MADTVTAAPFVLGSAGDLCYVCNAAKPGEQLTCCISAPVLQEMQVNGPMINVTEPDTDVVTDTVLSDLYKSGQTGRVARAVKANGYCKRYFHQSCLHRRAEASKDNKWTISTTIDEEKVLLKKDIRHHCCDPCLQQATGSTETCYSGKLDGKYSHSLLLLMCYSVCP